MGLLEDEVIAAPKGSTTVHGKGTPKTSCPQDRLSTTVYVPLTYRYGYGAPLKSIYSQPLTL